VAADSAAAVVESAAAVAVDSAAVEVADGSECQCNVKSRQSARRRLTAAALRFCLSQIHTAQGPHALGGAMNYIDNGAMTKGFALIGGPPTTDPPAS
jgi:hypothetical protein